MKLPLLNEILETERCILKIPQESEAQEIWNLITENTTKYMIWEKWETYETTLKNILSTRQNAFDKISWDAAVYDKTTWKTLGRCGINKTDSHTLSFEIGYWISETYYGKWIIPECVKALTKYMFEQWWFEKWVIRCDSENINSAKVALKCGYTFEWEFKKHEKIKWVFRDTKYFWITRKDYFSQK